VHDAIGHLAALIETADRLLEVRRGQTIEQVDDSVLQAAPRQSMNHLQDPQRTLVDGARPPAAAVHA
jgi:hypothetical protein